MRFSKGFTVIELVIVIAILAIAALGASQNYDPNAIKHEDFISECLSEGQLEIYGCQDRANYLFPLKK